MSERTRTLTPNQTGFIDFLVRSGVLGFGEFVLKSGRRAPYFLNFGKFDDGAKILQLGEFYAAHIVQSGLSGASVIFGPAYKGIPLAVSTSMALNRNHGITIGFSFDRKEAKDHGEGGRIVGRKLSDGDRVVLVEDVISAGTTMREVVPLLNSIAKISLDAVVIAVDRCERGTGTLSAVQEVEQNMGIKVCPLVTIRDIVEYLSKPNGSGFVIEAALMDRISAYWKEYGA